jgi:SecD/SecF fusion protein
MEIDQAFIAAILTVIGYSINDTVVVFDRIREFLNTYTVVNPKRK